MANKEKIKGLAKKLIKHPVRNIIGLGLAGLITITAVKDNVHFGSVALYNPQENHYTWGLAPTTEIKGNAKGNFYTIGVISGINEIEDNTKSDSKLSAYDLGFGGNNVGDNSKVNDMSAYGLIISENGVGDNTEINGDIITKGIIFKTPFGTGIGSKDIIGLKNYVHKLKKIDKEK